MVARALGFTAGSFDTALLLGNNLGIAGTPEGLRRFLEQLHVVLRPGGQILADLVDYTDTLNPTHLRYQRKNRARGLYPGTLGLRVEYDGKCGRISIGCSPRWLTCGASCRKRAGKSSAVYR